ncbi:hypothetical protein Xekj_00838 [Xenorhabdus sp. KJ12.1]|nr:hypothetical protein Xekj_00838 [Xenorhabdus sp. KJ12.1]
MLIINIMNGIKTISIYSLIAIQVNYQRLTHRTQEGDLYLWFLWGKYSTQRIAGADYTIKKYMMRRTDPVLKGKLLHKKIYLRHHAPMLLA